jgi:hypothetical protein
MAEAKIKAEWLAYAISARIMNRLADSTAGTAGTATRPTTTNTKTI